MVGTPPNLPAPCSLRSGWLASLTRTGQCIRMEADECTVVKTRDGPIARGSRRAGRAASVDRLRQGSGTDGAEALHGIVATPAEGVVQRTVLGVQLVVDGRPPRIG